MASLVTVKMVLLAIGVVDVDGVLVEHCDVVGIGVFSRAEERVLTDAGGDVEFACWCSDVERILRFFLLLGSPCRWEG